SQHVDAGSVQVVDGHDRSAVDKVPEGRLEGYCAGEGRFDAHRHHPSDETGRGPECFERRRHKVVPANNLAVDEAMCHHHDDVEFVLPELAVGADFRHHQLVVDHIALE